jgi:lipopolysaccharide/colanic/teichoic acid biosynthesis glycosyltransferase
MLFHKFVVFLHKRPQMKFYKPKARNILIDLLMLLLSYYVVLDWFPLTTNTPFEKYSWPTLAFTLAWVFVSYLFKRYKPLKKQKYYEAIIRLLYVCEILFIFFVAIIHLFFKEFSGFVLLSITLGALIVNYILISLYFAYRFAVEYREVEFSTPEERINAHPRPANLIDEESYNQLCNTIGSHSGKNVLDFLKKELDLLSGNTLVFIANDPENLQMNPNYKYSTMIQLERLNNMRAVNRKFRIINEKLPDHGLFVCCFKSKSTRKKEILNSYFKGLNYVVYSFYFIYKRVMPKIFFTRKFYYFISGDKDRVFSKTEVLGRLYCCGFKVLKEKKIGNLTYIISERIKQPEPNQTSFYGPLIRLRRLGKDGKPFKVYKMRTMHPFSEYLQGYIFDKHSLKEGGKFNKDFRVTTTGSIMRKYWLDELPMLINLFKGEMKIVGVRPLSAHFYSLYSKELQQKRNKFKPGLLPPFYADMPKTLEQIEQSEMKYLVECEKKGTFLTDFKYFFMILNNILIKKARSG